LGIPSTGASWDGEWDGVVVKWVEKDVTASTKNKNKGVIHLYLTLPFN